MSTPQFSLILATVGRGAELERLFDSLCAQDLRDFELILVDQNTGDPLASLRDHAVARGLPLRVLRHQPPALAAARNVGIAAARGSWLAFPDDDCWYDAGLLRRVAECARRTPPADGIVARWAEQPGGASEAQLLDWRRARAFRELPVSSITLFLRRSLLARIGGFDQRLGLGQWFGAGEETDLVMRALRAGAQLRYEPAAVVHHAFAALPPRDAAARAAAQKRARGTGALYAKHALPWWVIARGLAAPLLRPLLRGEFGAGFALGAAVARGRLDGWLGWHQREP